MDKNRGFIILPLLVVLIAIIGVGGYWLGKQNIFVSQKEQEAVTQKSQEVSGPIIGWKVYTNTQYGFSVKYPSGWKVGKVSNDNIVSFLSPGVDLNFFKDTPNPVPSITIDVQDIPFAEGSPKGNEAPSITQWKEISLDGVKGHSYKEKECAPTCPLKRVDFPYEGSNKILTMFIIALGEEELVTLNKENNTAMENADIATFDRMVSTLTFLDRSSKPETRNVKLTPDITVSVSGQVYRDDNCNKIKDNGERGISGAIVNIDKLPEYSSLKTLTTNEDGRYSFSTTIKENESITIQPIVTSPIGYQSYPKFDPGYGEVILSANKTDAVIDLPQLPYEPIARCK